MQPHKPPGNLIAEKILAGAIFLGIGTFGFSEVSNRIISKYATSQMALETAKYIPMLKLCSKLEWMYIICIVLLTIKGVSDEIKK